MNRFTKIAIFLTFIPCALTSCNKSTPKDISTLSGLSDVTRLFRPHQQSYSDYNGYFNSDFFVLVNIDINELGISSIIYSGTKSLIPNIKVNVLKEYTELHEDIHYFVGRLPNNFRYSSLYEYNNDSENLIYYSKKRDFYISYFDYCSQFNEFLCFFRSTYKSPRSFLSVEAYSLDEGKRFLNNVLLEEDEYRLTMSYLTFIPVKNSKLMLNSLIEFEREYMNNEPNENGQGEYKSPAVDRYELLFEDGMDVYTEFPQKLEEYYENYDNYVKQIETT